MPAKSQLLLCSVLAATAVAQLKVDEVAKRAPKVVHLPIEAKVRSPSEKLRARDLSSVDLSGTTIDQGYFTANVSIGNPPQVVPLAIAVDSADFLVPSFGNCDTLSPLNCSDAIYDPRASRTSRPLSGRNSFNWTFSPDFFEAGNYYTDNISFGPFSVNNVTFGVGSNDTDIAPGQIGLSFYTDQEGAYLDGTPYLPTLLDTMYQQGVIHSRAFSLYLNEPSTTGSILFGGVDTAKYEGSLVGVPLVPYGPNKTWAITMSSIGYTDESGSSYVLADPEHDLPKPAFPSTLDQYIILPGPLYDQVADRLVQYQDAQGTYGPLCDNPPNASLNFQFGGNGGPVIKVPYSNIAAIGTFQNGLQPVGRCSLLIGPSSYDYVILGATFFQSAYVVFDQDRNQLAIAQSNVNATGSNIVEITNTKDPLPGVFSHATATSATWDTSTHSTSFTTTWSSYPAGQTTTTYSTVPTTAVTTGHTTNGAFHATGSVRQTALTELLLGALSFLLAFV